MRAIAFKVTYNDGLGAGRYGLIGFRGVCSDAAMHHNIVERPRVWCSQPENWCRQYRDGTGPRPSGQPCYESRLLSPAQPFRFGGGYYHHGDRAGQPISVSRRAETADVAFLTTRLPGEPEQDRLIFGCYRIDRKEYEPDWGEILISDGMVDTVFPDAVAKKLRYWDYHGPNKDGSRFWGSGLLRHVNEEATVAILRDALRLMGPSAESSRLRSLLGASTITSAYPG